jgi:tellurite resistance protein TerC
LGSTVDRKEKFTIHKNGRKFMTASLATLIVVEFSDVLFAVDSIPAILAVTTDSFIVFTSNIFAILGLRNLYFFLANMMDKFKYMKYSLVFILLFVGIKMILINRYELPSYVLLCFILGALLIGILASIISNKKEEKNLGEPLF